MKLKENKNIFFSIFLAIILFVVYIVFICKHIDCLLDSDMSSELILADLLSNEGGIMSKSWYYSTEIRLINTQLIFTPLFKILSDWHTVRVVGLIILMLLMEASLFFLMKELKEVKAFPLAAVLLTAPVSYQYMRYVMLGGYYIPHFTISFIVLGLIVGYSENESALKRFARLAAIAILCVLSGAGGPRQIIQFMIPVALTSVIFKAIGKKPDLLFPSLVSAGSGCVGFVINRTFLAKHYDFYSWDEFKITDFSVERMQTVTNGFFHCLGFTSGSLTAFSVLQCAISILLAIIFIVITISEVRNIKKTDAVGDSWQRSFIATLISVALVIFVLLYLFTDMFYVDRYYLPIIVLFYPLIAMKIGTFNDKKLLAFTAVFLACVLLMSGIMYQTKRKTDLTREYIEVLSVLEKEDCSNGVATFWNGNVLTELSDGSIDVWVYDEPNDNSIDFGESSKWLQHKAHSTTVPTGKVFVLLHKCEYEKEPFNHFAWTYPESLSTENLTLYIFDSYEDLLELVN